VTEYRYHLPSGEGIPSVTEVLHRNLGWDTETLMNVAMDVGKGLRFIKREAADVGTLVHAYAAKMLCNKDPGEELPEIRSRIEGRLSRALSSLHAWVGSTDFVPIWAEERVVNEGLRVGGTPDLYGLLNGRRAVIDLKTGREYASHRCQIAAYATRLVMDVRNELVEDVAIVYLGKSEDDAGTFKQHVFDVADRRITAGLEAFDLALKLEHLRAEALR